MVTRSAADDAVLSLRNKTDDGIPNLLRQTPGLNQLIRRKPAVEFTHCERWSIDRRWRAYDGDSGAVWQAGIQEGILAGEVLSEDAGDALNRRLQAVVGVRRGEGNPLDHTAAIREYSGRSVNHQIRYGRVEQEHAQLVGEERQYQLEAHSHASWLSSAKAHDDTDLTRYALHLIMSLWLTRFAPRLSFGNG